MNMYSCENCNKTFNGIRPYESHLVSEKHKKKINEKPYSFQGFENCNVLSSDNELESSIIYIKNNYMCTICNTSLNSIDQVKSHIRGVKHLKAKTSLMTTNESLSHNQSINRVDRHSLSYSQMGFSPFKLNTPNDEIKESIENIEVFQPDEEIQFKLDLKQKLIIS